MDSLFLVSSVDRKTKNKKSPLPFITSTLQQVASNRLNMGAKKTMSVAQKLYEGIELENETVGLITYMRTDSVRLSNEFVSATNEFVKREYGKEYVGSVKVVKQKENVHQVLKEHHYQ